MIVIGTRGSMLARMQAEIVSKQLHKIGIDTEIRIIKTHGDSVTNLPLHELSGVGVFVREIDEHSLAGVVDIAVHSMKDIPTIRPEQLVTAAVMKRDSPHDILITNDNTPLEEMPAGAVIGTSSMRRRAQLNRFRDDLDIVDLRGNINTRLRKLRDCVYDGILLAEAGLTRMGWDLEFERLDIDRFIPSANQGTIAIVALRDSEAADIVCALNHPQTRIETGIERIVIDVLGGGCSVPIGAFSEMVGDEREIRVRAEMLSPDGMRYARVDETIPADSHEYQERAHRIGEKLEALTRTRL